MTNIIRKFQQWYISFIFLLASYVRQFRREVSTQGKKFRNLCLATPHPPRLQTTCSMKLFRPRTYMRARVIPHFLQTKPPFVLPICEKICPALLRRSFKIGTVRYCSIKPNAWVWKATAVRQKSGLCGGTSISSDQVM